MLSPGGINNESEELELRGFRAFIKRRWWIASISSRTQTEAKGAIGTANRTAVTLLMDQSER